MLYSALPTQEAERMDIAGRFQRVLDDRWKQLAFDRIELRIGKERAARQGGVQTVDTGSNPLRDRSISRSVLYLHGAYPTHRNAAAAKRMARLLTRAQWLGNMVTVQQRAEAMMDCPMRYEVSVDAEAGYRLILYPSSPAWASATEALPDNPSQPAKVTELAEHEGRAVLRAWSDTDVWLEEPGGEEIKGTRKAHYQGACPWLTWHVKPSHHLWTPIPESVYEATLTVAGDYTFVGAAVINAAWPQKYAINAEPAGASSQVSPSGEARTYVESDPSRIQAWRTVGNDGEQAQLGAFPQGADPKALMDTAQQQHRRASVSAGGSGADVYRASGETRSAYAISATRSNERAMQVRQAPLMHPVDVMLMERVALAAATVGAAALESEDPAAVAPLPLDGWGVRYRILPASPEEVQQIQNLLAPTQGPPLITLPEALMMYDPFLTEAEAEARAAALATTSGGDTDG